MTLLITKEIVAEKLQVAIGYDDKEFDTFIREAQELDLKPLLCEDFYYDLLSKKDDEAYAKLLSGGDYVIGARTYSFIGLSTVLAYFTYARFYLNSPGVSTSHGIVFKNNPQSTPVPLEDRRNVYYKKREDANTFLSDCKAFIDRNISDYPSYNNCRKGCGTSSGGSFSTTVIQ